jgi:glycosyltransferase involved in cell wall biosynthesis
LPKTGDNPILLCQNGGNPAVSIIIPTYKRGNLLNYVLEALTTQTSKDFEVLMIVKPSGDGTEQIIEKYRERLKIKIIIQKHGYFLDALNLGLKNAKGKIIIFLDDDAVPFPNLIHSHILSYSTPAVGGVAGDVVPVILRGNTLCPFEDTPSEIIPARVSETVLARKLGSRPLKGLEDYLIYISKAGFVSVNYEVATRALSQPVNSLLAKGANMSISSEASVGFQFPTSCVLGLTNEQYLGWYLWKKGYRVIVNTQIKAYHINHGQSLSRNIKNAKKEAVLCTEARLLFYRLYGSEPELSIMHRLVLLILEAIIDVKSICLHKDISRISMFKNKISAELMGLRWLVYKKLGLKYSPLADLEKILQ